jgi:hypothetical protein
MSFLTLTLLVVGIFGLLVMVVGLWGLARLWHDWPKPRWGSFNLFNRPMPDEEEGEEPDDPRSGSRGSRA